MLSYLSEQEILIGKVQKRRTGMDSRTNDFPEITGLLKYLWKEERYFVLFWTILYLYPVFTRHFMSRLNLKTSDLKAFFFTSFFLVSACLLLSIVFKHLLVFIPAFMLFLFLFCSFVAYLVTHAPGDRE